MSQKLKDIMTKTVCSVTPEQSAAEVAQTMNEYNIGSVPVMQNNQCIGMITDRDLALRVTAQGKDAQSTKVKSIMSTDVITASPDMDIHEAAKLMADNQIRRLPVVDKNGLTGVVALGDLATTNIFQNEAGVALSQISEPSSPQI